MVAPCLCKGSSKWVHVACLLRCKRTSYREVCQVCKSRYNCTDHDFIVTTIKDLRDDTTETQAAIAADYLDSLATSSQNEDAIREEGGIQALIHVLQGGNNKAQASAASALWHLAESSSNRGVICEAGGIEALIRLLWDGDEDCQERASNVLQTLLADNHYGNVICEGGGIEALINVLQCGSDEACTTATVIFGSLAVASHEKADVFNDMRGTLPETGGSRHELNKIIEALANLLFAGCLTSQKRAAKVFSALAENSENAHFICQEGGIALIKMLNGKNPEAEATATDVLRHLPWSTQNQDVIRKAIQSLIDVLKGGSQAAQANAADVIRCVADQEALARSYMSGALYGPLAEDSQIQDVIREMISI